jgi:hypothetical protein
MCIICVELEKDRLTTIEASRNLGEMVEVIGEEHVFEVLDLIREKEIQQFMSSYCEFCASAACDCD